MSRAESVFDAAKSGVTRLQDAASHGQRIVFFHVPKCGGTSVHQALRRAITFHGLGACTLDPKASKQAADAMGEHYLDLRERWLVYQVVRARQQFINGHFPWSPAMEQVRGDYRLITLLREPRAQLLSEFFYNRDKANVGHFSIDRDMSLRAFLTTDAARDIGCKFVQYFTDPALRHTAWEPEAQAAATVNLAKLDVVGTLEHLDDWVDRLGTVLGRGLRVGRENTSPTAATRRRDEIDDEVLALADEVCRPNQAVYRAALRLGATTPVPA